MATVINVPGKDKPFAGVGEGISKALGQATAFGIKDLFDEAKKKRFNENLTKLQAAGSKEEAMKLISRGNMAADPQEFLQMAQAVDEFYGGKPAKTSDTPVVDLNNNTVTSLQLTDEQINSPEALRQAFPNRNFRVAAKGEDAAKEWMSPQGDFLGIGPLPPTKDAVPLDVYNAKYKGGESKSKIFDENGQLTPQTVNSMREMASVFLQRTDARTGATVPPNATIYDETMQGATKLLHDAPDRYDITTAIVKAKNDAWARHPEIDPLPLSQSDQDQMAKQVYEYERGIDLIDKQLNLVGKGIGISSAAKQFWNYVVGQGGWNDTITFPKTQEARAAIVAMNTAIRQIITENVGKIPQQEQQWAMDQLSQPDKWFDTPKNAADRMRALRDVWMAARQGIGDKVLGRNADGTSKLRTIGSRADRIKTMTPYELRELDVRTLSDEEAKALDERLRAGGY